MRRACFRVRKALVCDTAAGGGASPGDFRAVTARRPTAFNKATLRFRVYGSRNGARMIRFTARRSPDSDLRSAINP